MTTIPRRRRFGRMTVILACAVVLGPRVSLAQDPECLSRPIVTQAYVMPSDGPAYVVETHFSSLDDAALRMVDENERFMAIQGPRTWAGLDGAIALGDERFRPFILGHQFHALLIHFDELLSDVHGEQRIVFEDEEMGARAGSSPFGGAVYKLHENESGRVPGMVFEFPGTPRIEVRFSDYEEVAGQWVPRRLVVDDGSAIFDYRFWSINLSESSSTWIDDHRAFSALIDQGSTAGKDRPAGRRCIDPGF